MNGGIHDLVWERSLPLVNLARGELAEILAGYDKTIHAYDATAIGIGCRNSNYVLETNRGKLLLRLTAGRANNERMADVLLGAAVSMPRLLHEGMQGDRRFLLYEYIEGEPLQSVILRAGRCEASVIEQAARAAATIHSTTGVQPGAIDGFTTPPFETWYGFFLSEPKAREHLGEDRFVRLVKMLEEKRMSIDKIAAMEDVLIHADFRPINMLIDRAGKVYIVDWESLGYGHALGDIGQFFRYRSYFSENDFGLFQDAYDDCAARKLPEGWEELSLLRDLVNPLQMLGSEWDAPNAIADFLSLVDATLATLGY